MYISHTPFRQLCFCLNMGTKSRGSVCTSILEHPAFVEAAVLRTKYLDVLGSTCDLELFANGSVFDSFLGNLLGSCGGFQLQVREPDSLASCRGESSVDRSRVTASHMLAAQTSKRQRSGERLLRCRAGALQKHWTPCMFERHVTACFFAPSF